MSGVKCNQCGHVLKETRGRYCPRCGDPYEDEVRKLARRYYRAKPWLVAGTLVAIVAVIGLSVLAVWADRHYSWTEDVTSDIVDKEYESYYTTYCTGGKYPHCSTQHHENWILILNNSHREYVYEQTYNAANVGEDYTYQVWHYDWKPGMEKAPIPQTVFIVPAAVGAGIVVVYLARIWLMRYIEVRQWKKSGDLVVGDSEE